jgi:hypothetical protein
MEHQLVKEKRYCVIIHVLRKKKTFMGANRTPHRDLAEAKKTAWAELIKQVRPKKSDVLTIKCMELEYCDVPINTVLAGTTYEMQPISNRWMTPEELRTIVGVK